MRKHKRVDDLLAVFARLRACYPMDVRLYVVMDNLNTHKHARLKAFMAAHNIVPAYTPTSSSWLNAIEAHVTSRKKFAIGGPDDPSHEYRRWRIARYLTWRNKEKGSSGLVATGRIAREERRQQPDVEGGTLRPNPSASLVGVRRDPAAATGPPHRVGSLAPEQKTWIDTTARRGTGWRCPPRIAWTPSAP